MWRKKSKYILVEKKITTLKKYLEFPTRSVPSSRLLGTRQTKVLKYSFLLFYNSIIYSNTHRCNPGC